MVNLDRSKIKDILQQDITRSLTVKICEESVFKLCMRLKLPRHVMIEQTHEHKLSHAE